MTTVEVRVIVRDANGRDGEVTLKDRVPLGSLIPIGIAKVAAEASALSYMALDLDHSPLVINRVDP